MPRAEPTSSFTPLRLLGAQPSDVEGDDGGVTDLLIQGLLDRLPKPNAIWSLAPTVLIGLIFWSLDDRAKWLRTAASIFGLVYNGDHREIGVVLLKQDAGNTPMMEGIAPGFIGQ